MKPLLWKSNIKHATLEYLIKEIDPSQDVSRPGITNRAIVVAKDTKKETWLKVMEELPKLPKLEIPIPTAMQVKPDDENEEALKKIEDDIKDVLGLRILQTQYEIQLLWMNYLDWLKVKAMNVGEEKNAENDLSGPEMIKRFVQILMLNREIDAPIIETIKNALLKWEE